MLQRWILYYKHHIINHNVTHFMPVLQLFFFLFGDLGLNSGPSACQEGALLLDLNFQSMCMCVCIIDLFDIWTESTCLDPHVSDFFVVVRGQCASILRITFNDMMQKT
jgi:hypothetical protein